MKTKLYFLAFVLTFASCKSTRFDKDTPVSESETIIIGQFKILNKQKDITKNSKIYLDENKKGVLSYKLDESGFILMKVPKGSHFIKLIYTQYGSANLPIGYANIAVPDHSNVYYIGNIEIQMDGNLAKKFQGAIYDSSPGWEKEKKLLINVQNMPNQAEENYKKEFGNDKKFVESLLKIEE